MGVIKPNGLTTAHLKSAGIGEDYWSADFGNYEGPTEAKDSVIRYLSELSTWKGEGVGILFGGPHGPGKTTLAMIAMKYLVRARWNVYCTSLGELVESIQRSWKDSSNQDEQAVVHRAKTVDFLLIDDVGKEHRGASGFVQTVFDNLIRYRVQHRLPTFLTTNHNRNQLEEIYGGSVISLLEGKTKVVVVNGKDYRRTVQKAALS